MLKEINKLLKRVNAEKLKNNHKECIELYNIIGGLYTDIGSYEEAIHYHEQALEACKKVGDQLGIAVTLRYIGESRASLGQFYQAIEDTTNYLELVRKTNNKVEIQRAWTTLGRVYLMQAQDMKDNSNVIDKRIKDVASKAEKRFQTALNLAESVRSQIDEKEFAQMKSGLLINMGLVKDICGQHRESVLNLNQAVEICKSKKLREDLYRCQIILTGLFRQRNNIEMATKSSEEALRTAEQIGKKLLICDAYIERGLVQIFQKDFKNAKRTFAQAYLEKSPNEEDHAKAIKLTKLSHLICATYEEITKADSSESRSRLAEKLGDLFVAVNSYKLAIEFYKKAYKESYVCRKPKEELARILYSLGETYADDEQFEQAIICYEKELKNRSGNDKEQCQSMLRIAHMHEYLNRDSEQTKEAYEKALEKAGLNVKLKYNVLKDYVEYLKKVSADSNDCQKYENILTNLKSFPEVVEALETDGNEEAHELEDEIPNIDDILSDDDDNDEAIMLGRRKGRGSKKLRSNEVGETPLHEACIKGDMKRVVALINQGHHVNPKDNAGWTPLHEACNHGHFNIAEYLIQHGADVSNRGMKGMSPLHDAATNGHIAIMRLLISNGANVIAESDTGSTVLDCFQDYKKRNFDLLSNEDMSECRQVEAELLNIMDKCGYSIIKNKMKNLGSRSTASNSNNALEEPVIIPKQRSNLPDSTPITDPVRNYRDVMGTLKRKRNNQDEETSKKINLPATFQTEFNTSAPTKEWLIDDVSREKRILDRRPIQRSSIECDDIFSDDDIDICESISRLSPQKTIVNQDRCGFQKKKTNSSLTRTDHKKVVLVSDDDENDEDDVVIIGGDKTSEISENPREEDEISLGSPLEPVKFRTNSSVHSFSMANENVRQFALGDQPLVVSIEGRKLLVPVKDEYASIRWLKDSIVEKYSSLFDCKPNISLAPLNDPVCIMFDDDLCKDVIRDINVIATIKSWQLETIEEEYTNNCSKEGLTPLGSIKAELRRISHLGNKLDLSYMRVTRKHIGPLRKSLIRRSFTHANLVGSTCLFEPQIKVQEMLDTLATWTKLSHLILKCVGLSTQQFETICTKIELPEMRNLDVSVNAIMYKCKTVFKAHIESLVKAWPNLKRLDMRKNHLQFVKSICESTASELDLSRILELSLGNSSDLEILGAYQNEYSVYSA